MQAMLRRPNILLNNATKDSLIRLLNQQPRTSNPQIAFPLRQLSTSPFFRTHTSRTLGAAARSAQHARYVPFRRTRGIRYNSTNTQIPQPPKKEGRFKELTRKYGWAAVGVYFGLSALDFPFCFLAVRLMGTDRIAEAERVIVDGFWVPFEKVAPGSREAAGRWWTKTKDSLKPVWESVRGKQEAVPLGDGPVTNAAETAESVEKKEQHHEASLGVQLALAYAVHKSLIFFRVPATAAITPGIVKWLRKRGWNIGNVKKT